VGITATGDNTEYNIFNDKYYKVANSTANDFTLQDLSGNDLDSDDFTGTYLEDGTCGETTTTVSGLSHLEGETVSILADGQVLAQTTVASGSISFTGNSIGYAVIHVGLPYSCDLQTLRLEPADGTTIQGKVVSIYNVKLRFQDSSGGSIGYNTDNLTPIKPRDREYWRQPNDLRTSDTEVSIKRTHSITGRISFRQSNPLPTTILMYIMEYEVGGV